MLTMLLLVIIMDLVIYTYIRTQDQIMIDGIIKMVQQNMKPTEIAV